MILVQWILRPIRNHLLQCHLGVRPCLCTFDTGVPAPKSQDDRDPSLTQNELFYLLALLHRSLLSCFWLLSAAMPVFSQVFPIRFSCAAFASGNVHAWSIGMNLRTRLLWLNEFTPFAVIWSSWYRCDIPSSRILKDSSASTIQAYLVLRLPILLQVSPQQFTGVSQVIAAGIGMSNFLRAFVMVCFLFFIIWFNEEDTT